MDLPPTAMKPVRVFIAVCLLAMAAFGEGITAEFSHLSYNERNFPAVSKMSTLPPPVSISQPPLEVDHVYMLVMSFPSMLVGDSLYVLLQLLRQPLQALGCCQQHRQNWCHQRGHKRLPFRPLSPHLHHFHRVHQQVTVVDARQLRQACVKMHMACVTTRMPHRITRPAHPGQAIVSAQIVPAKPQDRVITTTEHVVHMRQEHYFAQLAALSVTLTPPTLHQLLPVNVAPS